jgi:hypothetical protein
MATFMGWPIAAAFFCAALITFIASFKVSMGTPERRSDLGGKLRLSLCAQSSELRLNAYALFVHSCAYRHSMRSRGRLTTERALSSPATWPELVSLPREPITPPGRNIRAYAFMKARPSTAGRARANRRNFERLLTLGNA